jgi:hypothetical protein
MLYIIFPNTLQVKFLQVKKREESTPNKNTRQVNSTDILFVCLFIHHWVKYVKIEHVLSDILVQKYPGSIRRYLLYKRKLGTC